MTENGLESGFEINRRNVLKTAGMLGTVGVLGLPAFSVHARAITQEECPDDVVLLATENNHPNIGDTEMDVNIYAIYPAVGENTLIETLTVPVNGSSSNQSGPITDNFNGNAWDDQTSRFYFSRYDRMGPAGGNPLPSELYFTELDGTYTHSGTLEEASAGAAFYNGEYYYIGQRTDDLRKVTFNADGTIDADDHVADIFGDGDTVGFGDITIKDDVIYASATRISDFEVLFFKVNTDGTGYSEISTGALYGAGGTQISFGKDGVLYGVNARNPQEVFSIDTETGDTTFIDELPVAFSDLSTGPLCTECVECTGDDLLAKYEFACVEEIDDECVDYDFVFEKGDSSLVTYVSGNFESKEGESFEPVSATFSTDYCSVFALVKAGPELIVQERTAVDGEITVEYVDPYAISFVAFYCTEEAAQTAADAFPANGGGESRGRGRNN